MQLFFIIYNQIPSYPIAFLLMINIYYTLLIHPLCHNIFDHMLNCIVNPAFPLTLLPFMVQIPLSIQLPPRHIQLAMVIIPPTLHVITLQLCTGVLHAQCDIIHNCCFISIW